MLIKSRLHVNYRYSFRDKIRDYLNIEFFRSWQKLFLKDLNSVTSFINLVSVTNLFLSFKYDIYKNYCFQYL